MSILIKGTKMPKNCASCKIEQEVAYADETGFPYIGAHRCPLVYPSYTDESRYKGLLPNCPLVSVPPHGGLIDADAICYQLEKQATIDGQPRAIRRARRVVESAPTIIDAEGVE